MDFVNKHNSSKTLEKNRIEVFKKGRIKNIDIAKAIGIFLIVLGHVLKFGQLRKFIYSFHVPLFFFLSGMCFSVKDNKIFIKNKIKQMYIPYIVVSVVSIGIYLTMGKFIGASNLNFVDNIIGMFYANPNYANMQWNQPLWFLPCLMLQLILINIFENFIKSKKYEQIIRGLVLVIVCVIGYICSYLKIFLPLQLEAGMCMLVFTYIGIWVRKNKEKLESNKIYKNIVKRKSIAIVFFIVTIFISTVLVYHNETVSVMHDNYGDYLKYSVSSISMIINIMIISSFIDYVMGKQKIISYIGQSTLVILLLHKFPILFFQEICPIIKNLLNQNDTILNNIISIIVSFIVIFMCMICKYIIDIIVRRKQYDRN